METVEALSHALDLGVSLEFKHWHLWKSKGSKPDYVLLKFSEKGDPMDNTEERFPNCPDGKSDAIHKFLRKTKSE